VRPATAVMIPGSLAAPPTVQTPSWRTAISRMARAARAAAAKLSRRMAIGVAPAWAVCPQKTTVWRSTPQVPRTALAGSPRAESTGPCSM
jgi:hypothetical protein